MTSRPRFFHAIFDRCIESTIPIPELHEVADGIPSWRFRRECTPPSDLRDATMRHRWQDAGGSTTFRYASNREGEGRLTFPEIGDYLIAPDGTRITAHASSAIPDSIVRQILIDQVLPRTVAQAGNIVLHASAVAINGVCLALVGRSGSGKSTFAADLVARGATPITDDALLVLPHGERPRTFGSSGGLRLLPPSIQGLGAHQWPATRIAGTQKLMLMPRHVSGPGKEWPLRAIALMNPTPGPPRIRTYKGSQALFSLLGACFSLLPQDRDFAGTQLDRLAWVLERTPTVIMLSFPHRFSHLREAQDALLAETGLQLA